MTGALTGDKARVAEFFAGIGLVRAALGREFKVVFANDIDPKKYALYKANFRTVSEFVLEDIAKLRGDNVPDVDLATASFPCTDLSLAGNRKGLAGSESSMFWQFARIIEEMKGRRPQVILLENVPGLATSRNGDDLKDTIAKLNDLGYACDMVVGDARWFVPQSRQRLFIIGTSNDVPIGLVDNWSVSAIRPEWMARFVVSRPSLHIRPLKTGLPPHHLVTLAEIVDRPRPRSNIWWVKERVEAFVESLSEVQLARLERMRGMNRLTWATAYRRTRKGKATWEIRDDSIAGCLRTTRGGSSKQAVVEAGRGKTRVRWMSAREYAKLQGFPNFRFDPNRENDALFALGDAICVPVVRWVVKQCVAPVLFAELPSQTRVAR